MALKILLIWSVIVTMVNSSSPLPEDHHRSSSYHHRIVWPIWYRDRLVRSRHNHQDDRTSLLRESNVTRTSWTPRSQIFMTRLPQQVNAAPRYNVEQRTQEHNAFAVMEYNGTRTIAYYHSNDRDESRDTVTQSYQLVPTTGPTTYIRHHPGLKINLLYFRRRVCTRQTPATSHQHRERQIRLVYTELTPGFLCCPGWSQVTHLSFGCNKPMCSIPCLNGGICALPGKCICPKGYSGNQCQTDVDECTMEKPCGQLCTNLPGSYQCHCRPGFRLQQDGQSCRRNDTDENAFEAHDLESEFHDVSTTKDPVIPFYDTENEIDDDDQNYKIILKRLIKLERQVAKNRKRNTEAIEMNSKITIAIESVNEMKRRVENMQLMQQEIYDMRNKVKQYEAEIRRMQHLMSRVTELENRLRIRCRSMIPINSRSLNF